MLDEFKEMTMQMKYGQRYNDGHLECPSLNRPGALAKLKGKLNKYRIAITAVQETRWSGREMFDSGDFVICYSRNKRRDNLEQDS